MIATCCERNRDTRFCADCGKRLREVRPVDLLLEHCRLKARSHLTAIDNGSAAFHKDMLEKWVSWVEALEDLLNTEAAAKDVIL